MATNNNKKRNAQELRQLEWVDKQNQARAELGLPLLVIKERKCLSCDKTFLSASNRRCARCRKDTPH
jgi:uncharacterized paraquat-inducible protein A